MKLHSTMPLVLNKVNRVSLLISARSCPTNLPEWVNIIGPHDKHGAGKPLNDAVMGFHSIPLDCRAVDIFSDFRMDSPMV